MNYAELDALLVGRCKLRRKLANNTWARRDDKMIGIVLHNTEILRYNPHGQVEINLGGWRSPLTISRLRQFLPYNLNIWSEHGTWFLSCPDPSKNVEREYGDGHFYTSYGYRRLGSVHSGMTVTSNYLVQYLDGYDPYDRTQRNELIDKLTRRYLRSLTPQRFNAARKNGTDGDCRRCANCDADDLYRHLALRDYQFTLFYLALQSEIHASTLASYALAYSTVATLLLPLVKDALADYFKRHLYFKPPQTSFMSDPITAPYIN